MSGHGHVIPNPDGTKARCGGPAICPDCAREAMLAGYHGDEQPKTCPACGQPLPAQQPVRVTEG